MLTVRPAAGETIAELAARLERDPRVVAVEPEYRHQPRLVPSDPAMSQPDPGVGGQPYQWYLHRQGFPAAWDLSRGTGALVGMIDSGIDSAHPDLAAKVAIARDHDGTTAGTGDEVGHGTHVGRPRMRRDRQRRRDRGRRLGLPPDPGEERPHQLERDRVARRRRPERARS